MLCAKSFFFYGHEICSLARSLCFLGIRTQFVELFSFETLQLFASYGAARKGTSYQASEKKSNECACEYGKKKMETKEPFFHLHI